MPDLIPNFLAMLATCVVTWGALSAIGHALRDRRPRDQNDQPGE